MSDDKFTATCLTICVLAALATMASCQWASVERFRIDKLAPPAQSQEPSR